MSAELDLIGRNAAMNRDSHGRFVKGVSGNPRGRPVGTRNCKRQQDPGSAATWRASDWRLLCNERLHAAHSNIEAALFEIAALYVIVHPPKTGAPGMCARCGKPLSLRHFSEKNCPVPVLRSWTHAVCAALYSPQRLTEAAHEIMKMGVAPGATWPT